MSEAMSKMTATAPRIAYEDVGQGEPALLFLPGWVSDHTQVDATAPARARARLARARALGETVRRLRV